MRRAGRHGGWWGWIIRRSAGLLLFREVGGELRVLLAHMGGPFWARRDAGAWSVPKGEFEADEDPRVAALREFTEELGSPPPAGEWLELGERRQSGGKAVICFALRGDFDAAAITSNTFEIEWPRGSGRFQAFPEIDRAEWCGLDVARARLVRGQVGFLDTLVEQLAGGPRSGRGR